MWLPLRLIDCHHSHIVEAFTTWNKEESAAIERKRQSNTNNGVSYNSWFFFLLSLLLYKCHYSLFMSDCDATSHFYLCEVLVSSERYLVSRNIHRITNLHRYLFDFDGKIPPVDIIQERHCCMRKS